MKKIHIGWDPGMNGAMAWKNGDLPVQFAGTPGTCEAATDLILTMLDYGSLSPKTPLVFFHFEKVGSYIPGGGASQMFEYGRGVERIECIVRVLKKVLALPITLNPMTPQAWQKELNLGKSERMSAPRAPKGLDRKQRAAWELEHQTAISLAKQHNDRCKRDWKNGLKEEARRRYPSFTGLTLTTCDALLILDAGMQIKSRELF